MRSSFHMSLLALVAFCFFYSNSYSQEQMTVSGKVIDGGGNALIGASVQIENTLIGTITDINGDFSLTANSGDVLIVRMISMEPVKVTVTDTSPIRVTLLESKEILDEVVINGFQEVDRKLFTGASEHVKMEDIKAAGMVDVGRMLEGQVAGVNVDNVSGTFGTSPKIRIRGNSSINGNNQPLYVVDGVILEDLNNVSTDDFISGNANTLNRFIYR